METTPVTFVVLGVEPVRGAGRLIGLANVAVELSGVELTLQGVQLVRRSDGSVSVQAPQFRHPRDGRWLPAVLLPSELRDAIAAEALALALAGGG